MIPLFAVIRFARDSGPHIWVPLFLIWLLLAPLVVVLLPLAFIACLAFRIDPFEAGWVLWSCLSATRGTRIEVTTRKSSLLIHII